MKVSQIKELLAGYSDDTELMIAWNDKDQYEYILEKPLPTQVWEKAVANNNGLELNDYHEIVIVKTGELK